MEYQIENMHPPGTILLGKYRIERILGEGGMGVVAKAHHIQLDQPVAIKFLRPEVLSNHQVVTRFVREAQAAVKLKSEHVCKVHDVGTLESGSPYMVMEFMEGTELGALVTAQGRPGPGMIVELMLQACEGLAEAHALGIVHRDIKPANLFVTRGTDGSALLKVLDFGISKTPATVDSELTSTQAVMGTPAYMSPEQMRATKHVDARTDIWALGVVLYELLSGQRPFRGQTFSELCLQIGMDPTPVMNAAMPGDLQAIVMRCLEKDPARRVQSVAELAAALAPHAEDPARAARTVERIARVLGLAANPFVALSAASMASAPWQSTFTAGAGQLATQPAPSRRLWLIAGTAVAVLATAGLTAVLGRDRDATAPAGNGASADRPAAAVPAEPHDHHDHPDTRQSVAQPADRPRPVAQEPDAGQAPADEPAARTGAGNENNVDVREARGESTTVHESPRSTRQRRSSRGSRSHEPGSAGKTRSKKGSAGKDDLFDTRQ